MRILSICAAVIVAASPLIAQTSDTGTDSAATCVLSFNGKIYSEGPCEGTFFEEGVTDVSGTVEESGQAWQIVIDEEKGSGVLIGANTFVLAEGSLLETQGGASYVWPNGYAVDVAMELGDDM